MSKPDFFPTKTQPMLIRLVQSISYWIGRFKYQLKLRVSEADLGKVRELGDARIVLMPNHPTFDDGLAVFLFATQLGEIFNYLVAHENFDGWLGDFLPKMGCYSIRRGLGDRRSISHTLELLKEERARMVIFPEGGCSFQNDAIMPFRTGAIQLPFQAMQSIAKKTKEFPPCYLVPISIKYRYLKSGTDIIEKSLQNLESHFGIQPESKDFYPRLRRVSEAVMSTLEDEYNIEPPAAADWNDRINLTRKTVLNLCQEQLGISFPDDFPLRERVYKMQALLIEKADDEFALDLETYEKLYQSTMRLLNFDAIYDGYVEAYPTPERFIDTLTRLEREVFRVEIPEPKGLHEAWLKVGEPLNIQDYAEQYQGDRQGTIAQLTDKMQFEVQNNLLEMMLDDRPELD
ncbi:1-acyl-sn-glycerol-3-phosphate acyltransferase [[Limnothrix rosea] IAM M-220]|uniref:1-acyl-sn-glycerol-3-phosphate acyltransferase n=1 Tax=[Limnothrix rosea] IAM M-220 TaxID=454133 RepID=UPI00095960DA|nr:1-acyl-sn-glycerol-3-phosphate acyltransferase [[Limnothrix rosea] IAM M-220]OKH13757.1 1-acyl-sn-glycerol-3-phosphate acyltransferase [[Limnothrix rosea] IAM M-220]